MSSDPLVLGTHRYFPNTFDNPHLSTERLLMLLLLLEKRKLREVNYLPKATLEKLAGLELEPRFLIQNQNSFYSVTLLSQITKLFFQFLLMSYNIIYTFIQENVLTCVLFTTG